VTLSDQTTPLGARDASSDDMVLPFEVPALGVRGRLVRIGSVVDDVIRRHEYPQPVAAVLGEAVALTGLLGALLKFDGKFILQTKTDGPVNFLVVDFTSPGKLRGLAQYDAEKLTKLMANGNTDTSQLLGEGHLAMTIDQGRDMERYQGVVALEGQSLSDAAHSYFKQSEQIPTMVKLSSAPLIDIKHEGWRAGGILIQHLPKEGGARAPDLPPGDVPGGLEGVPEFEEDDNWAKAKFLLETVEDHELLDPMLSSEKLLYRLFHEDGVRVFPDLSLEWHCHCSRERTTEMLSQFSVEDKRYMIKDGQVEVTCEFCNTTYRFDPEELD